MVFSRSWYFEIVRAGCFSDDQQLGLILNEPMIDLKREYSQMIQKPISDFYQEKSKNSRDAKKNDEIFLITRPRGKNDILSLKMIN